jgi:hypothetical protein
VGGDTTTRDAIRGRMERLRAYRARLERMEADDTYHPVETQTHYATRTEGVASGELRVLVEFTTIGDADRRRWRGRLYDETELVNGEMHFEEEADSYEAMMEALFVQLSRSYPAGDMSFGYQIWNEHVRPTRQFRRLSRSTESTASRASETVFSPEAQIAVNLATMLLALFPPTSGIGVALGFAYNAAATAIDESERWRVGRGDATRTTIQLGLLMCDLLPGVGRGGRALVIAGHAATLVEHGANAYIFYDDYREQLTRLRDGQVTELARVHAELVERRAMNLNDPEIPRLETEVRRLQAQVQDAAEELFTSMASEQALLLAAAHGIEAMGSHGDAPHLPPGDGAATEPHRRIEGADGDAEGGTIRRRADDEGGETRAHGDDDEGATHADREPRRRDDEDRPRAESDDEGHRRADGEGSPRDREPSATDESTTPRRGDDPAAGDDTLPHVPMDAEGAVAREIDPADAARRLGVALFEVDPRLGRDVEVDYAVAANGEIAVVGVRAGPEASAADIAAHREVVRSLERYNGTLGRFRAMWDGIQLRFGHVPDGAVPPELAPGTVGYDAYLEVRKLERIVRQRRAALGLVDGGHGHLSETDATRLADDIAFLDDEIERYRGILETGGGAASDGVVRSRMPGDDAAVVAAGYPDPGEDYWFINSPAAIRAEVPFQIQRREGARSDAPVLRVVPHGSLPADQVIHAGAHFDLVAGTPSRAERAAAILAGFPVRARERVAALRARFEPEGAQVVPLAGVATTDVRFSSLHHPDYPDVMGRIEEIIFQALPGSLSETERRTRARAATRALGRHTITVVRGTDQLRAHNYRLAYGDAEGDLHHLIPLYLGGEHTRLIDMDPAYHDQLHELIDGIQFDDDTTLAPHSIQAADLNFREGAAVLHDNGRVTLYRWNGSRMVEIPRRGGGGG